MHPPNINYGMRGAGQIPEDVAQQWDNAGVGKGGKKRQAKIVKKLFVKKKGRWVVDPKRPMFKEKVTRSVLRAPKIQ